MDRIGRDRRVLGMLASQFSQISGRQDLARNPVSNKKPTKAEKVLGVRLW